MIVSVVIHRLVNGIGFGKFSFGKQRILMIDFHLVDFFIFIILHFMPIILDTMVNIQV